VTGLVVMDSHEVVGGALFVALSGFRVDGHAFIGRALSWRVPSSALITRP
jgi:UDP-N-acetylmuramyl pentapeptide synthase